MPLTQAEFDDVVKLTCPHCGAGNTPRFRSDTNEWVHDFSCDIHKGKSITHTFCLASGIRRVFAEQQANAQA
jgi:hypothetical protein